MKVADDFPLRGWLKGLDNLHAWGFTDQEIDKALQDAGMALGDLTDNQFTQQEPWHAKDNCKSPCQFVRKGSGTVVRYLSHGGLQYEARETVMGFYYRVPAQYQSLRHGAIMKALLRNRFPWFDDFKWDAYDFSTKDWYEVYMKTSKGSLYVPIRALMKHDPQIIIDRMVLYHTNHRKKVSYSCNKKERESFEEFCQRQESRYHQNLQPMYTKEAMALYCALRRVGDGN